MSVNSQQGHAHSRRDDLESLVYTIIYLARGKLPWASWVDKIVLWKKSSITVEELCKGLPAPFCKFVNRVRSLGFDEMPDYQYLHSVLLECSEQAKTYQPGKSLSRSTRSCVYSDGTPGCK